MSEELEPGIYFGMPDDTYHSLPYLSSTGIKNLLVSPMDFWARSWMNPWKEEDDEDDSDGKTKHDAKTIGKAYHKRILEGAAAFRAAYAPAFQCEDPDVLRSADDIKDALFDLGLSKAGSKEKLIERLLDADPEAKIYDVLLREYIEDHPGVTFLSDKVIRRIELSAKMIECHDDLKFFFVGGYPEVSIVWDDEELGVRMKVRTDYLKVSAVNDLKTFANLMNKPTERAIYSAMASNKYHIQGALYLRGVDASKQMVKEGRVFGREMVDQKWLAAFAESADHTFNFVFQQKGIAPVAMGCEFNRQDPMFDQGMTCIKQGVELFKRNMSVFGEDPWVDTRKPFMLHWAQYPAYANDL